MNKYSFALLYEIKGVIKDEFGISPETKISDLFKFNEDYDELDWINSLFNLELTYGFDIPDEIADQKELTILEFGEKLSKLYTIPNVLYSQFHELKTQLLTNTFRSVKIQYGLEEGTQEEINELKKRAEKLYEQIKEITELPLN